MSKRSKSKKPAPDVISSNGGRVQYEKRGRMKRSRIRRRKRRKIRLNIPPSVVVTFGITAAVAVVVLLSFTMFFNVSQADIQGSELYTYDQILVMSGVTNRTNLLRMDTGIIEQRLVNGLPYVKEAKVTKQFPDTLKIELKEAEKRASLEHDGKYMYISDAGVVLETDGAEPAEGCPIIYGFEPRKNIVAGMDMQSKDNLKAKIVMSLLKSLDDLDMGEVSEIDISDRTNIVMRYDDRIDIYIGSSFDMEFKLESMKSVIDKGLTTSFKGMLKYNGTDSGITARTESAVARWDMKNGRLTGEEPKAEPASQPEPAESSAAEPDTQPPERNVNESEVTIQAPEPAQTTVVTTEPPPETTTTAATTWNGW